MTAWWDMGPYGVYVYSAYGLALLVLVANIAWPYLRLRHLRRSLRREHPE